MKINSFIFLITTGWFVLTSCADEKKNLAFYDNENISNSTNFTNPNLSNEQIVDAGVISVPFTKKNGVMFVDVSVNGFGFEMIFDTGCSGTLISVAEANYLYQKGYLTNEDILGIAHSQIADGSIVENMVVNLDEVIIDGKIKCNDVKATVSANNSAPLLLGNEVLHRVASYSVDNENNVINFSLK